MGWKMWGPISGRGRTGFGAEGDGVRRHTLLRLRKNERSSITTPPARLRGGHRDNCTRTRVSAALNTTPGRVACEREQCYRGTGFVRSRYYAIN